MAIRLNDNRRVKELLESTGIAKSRTTKEELSHDGRLLTYAAYRDQGTCAAVLMENGFDPSQLDELIMLEISRQLHKHKLHNTSSGRDDEPPEWYVDRQSDVSGDRESIVRYRWSLLSKEQKKQIYNEISWNMMPMLPGMKLSVAAHGDAWDPYGPYRFPARPAPNLPSVVPAILITSIGSSRLIGDLLVFQVKSTMLTQLGCRVVDTNGVIERTLEVEGKATTIKVCENRRGGSQSLELLAKGKLMDSMTDVTFPIYLCKRPTIHHESRD